MLIFRFNWNKIKIIIAQHNKGSYKKFREINVWSNGIRKSISRKFSFAKKIKSKVDFTINYLHIVQDCFLALTALISDGLSLSHFCWNVPPWCEWSSSFFDSIENSKIDRSIRPRSDPVWGCLFRFRLHHLDPKRNS